MRNEIFEIETYEAPELQVVCYETEDIVTASGLDNDFSDPWGVINK